MDADIRGVNRVLVTILGVLGAVVLALIALGQIQQQADRRENRRAQEMADAEARAEMQAEALAMNNQRHELRTAEDTIALAILRGYSQRACEDVGGDYRWEGMGDTMVCFIGDHALRQAHLKRDCLSQPGFHVWQDHSFRDGRCLNGTPESIAALNESKDAAACLAAGLTYVREPSVPGGPYGCKLSWGA